MIVARAHTRTNVLMPANTRTRSDTIAHTVNTCTRPSLIEHIQARKQYNRVKVSVCRASLNSIISVTVVDLPIILLSIQLLIRILTNNTNIYDDDDGNDDVNDDDKNGGDDDDDREFYNDDGNDNDFKHGTYSRQI